jgi:hypothetical protein
LRSLPVEQPSPVTAANQTNFFIVFIEGLRQ